MSRGSGRERRLGDWSKVHESETLHCCYSFSVSMPSPIFGSIGAVQRQYNEGRLYITKFRFLSSFSVIEALRS